jgi:hypothetical protein
MQLVLLNTCELVGFALMLPVGQTREVKVQCVKKLVKCFERFDCSGNTSRTREGKNMSLGLCKSP